MGKQKIKNNTDILSASEIGQYQYCSFAWLLQRYGYEHETPFLESGKQIHISLGETINRFEKKIHYAKWYTILGIVVLCIGLLLFLLEVIL